jgi:hypothetical protein
VPIPYARPLEYELLPTKDKIRAAVEGLVG